MKRRQRRVPFLFPAVFLAAEVAAQEGSYWLPFPFGQRVKVWLGNGEGSHTDVWNRYAFDFSPLPEGSPVHACASGKVVFTKADTAGPTGDFRDNNEVAIEHADGNVSVYYHLRKDGVVVKLGQQVLAGDLIAWSGNTGASTGPHLHVALRRGQRLGPSVPLRFADLPGRVAPRTGDEVRSLNYPVALALGPVNDLVEMYDLCAALDAREAMLPHLRDLRTAAGLARVLGTSDALKARDDLVRDQRAAVADLLDRHRGDARKCAQNLESLITRGEKATARRLALLAARDFTDDETAEVFRDAIVRLYKEPGTEGVHKEVQVQIQLRERIAAAVVAELKQRELARAGRRPDWQGVNDSWMRALVATPDSAVRDHLAQWVRSAGAR